MRFAIYIYTEGYSESTEPIDAVNILPLARFEPTTSTTPPSTTPDIDATNCATETSPKKDVQEALILTTPDAVHVVYIYIYNLQHLSAQLIHYIPLYIYIYIYISLEAKYLQHLSAQLIHYIPLYLSTV